MIRPLIALGLLASLQPAHGQTDNYPVKPVRMIVPSAPGSGPDTMARAVSQQLSKVVGQPVVVENRASAPSASRRSRQDRHRQVGEGDQGVGGEGGLAVSAEALAS